MDFELFPRDSGCSPRILGCLSSFQFLKFFLLFLNLGAIPHKNDTKLVFCFEGSIGTFTDPEQLFVESPGLKTHLKEILEKSP